MLPTSYNVVIIIIEHGQDKSTLPLLMKTRPLLMQTRPSQCKLHPYDFKLEPQRKKMNKETTLNERYRITLSNQKART
eukprot:Pgem_evm1s12723